LAIIAHADVSNFLRYPTGGFSASTYPTSTTVGTFIDYIESEISHKTKMAFTSTTVSNEFYDYDGSGYLKLKNRNIVSFTSGTDKMEVYELVSSETYTDMILTTNGYVEGRGSDFWVDYTVGMVHFNIYNLKA